MSRPVRYQFEILSAPAEHAGAIEVLREELDALGDLGPRGMAAVRIPEWSSLDDLRAKVRATFAAARGLVVALVLALALGPTTASAETVEESLVMGVGGDEIADGFISSSLYVGSGVLSDGAADAKFPAIHPAEVDADFLLVVTVERVPNHNAMLRYAIMCDTPDCDVPHVDALRFHVAHSMDAALALLADVEASRVVGIWPIGLADKLPIVPVVSHDVEEVTTVTRRVEWRTE